MSVSFATFAKPVQFVAFGISCGTAALTVALTLIIIAQKRLEHMKKMPGMAHLVTTSAAGALTWQPTASKQSGKSLPVPSASKSSLDTININRLPASKENCERQFGTHKRISKL